MLADTLIHTIGNVILWALVLAMILGDAVGFAWDQLFRQALGSHSPVDSHFHAVAILQHDQAARQPFPVR